MRPSLRRLLTLVLLGLLPGCSGADLVNTLTPRGGYAIERGLAYAPGPRHGLDLYVPDGADAATPVVVFFYGGRWQEGERADYRFVGQAFASRGLIAVIPDYRLYPLVRYPAFLEDAAAAVAWVRQWTRDTGSPDRPVFLAGHSAGAYIAMMLAVDPRWLGGVGMEPCRDLNGAIGLAGPYDFLPLTDTDLIDLFGPEPGWPATQPINAVDGQAPPVFLATGDSDLVVRPANSLNLAAAIRARGGEAEVKVYAGLGHIGMVSTLASPLRLFAPVLNDAADFVRRHEGARGAACGPSS